MGDDEFQGGTIPSDVSIYTANREEIMTGSHITEQHTLEYQGPVPPELLNITPNKPPAYDSPRNNQLDSPNNFKDLDILSKTDNITNNVLNIPAIDVLNQENQD